MMNKLFKPLLLTVLFFIVSCGNKSLENSKEIPAVKTKINEASNNSKETLKFEAGDYNISWAGSPFKTTLVKTDKNTLTGNFCVNNKIDKCKSLGPITIVKNENTVTFHFNDIVCKISDDKPGEFNGTGTLINDNTYSFLVSGKDCKRTYTDKKVIFTKI